MLNPIDAAAVLRDGRATGLHPSQIHAGVAWWLGACLVVTQKATTVAVAHDGDSLSAEYAARLARGATNALHYRCRVTLFLSPTSPEELRQHAQELGGAPFAYITTSPGSEVAVALFDAEGKALTEESGLAEIRTLIERDRVPLPVNDSSRGTIQHREKTDAR
ncbi:hypothetical protein [Streptomyces sp. NPDC050264]|uniref:hypothetical protein n=1 Tax=Streptomyces sp. NPDC050264 TaxID=3155038 RepID=UPI00344917CA